VKKSVRDLNRIETLAEGVKRRNKRDWSRHGIKYYAEDGSHPSAEWKDAFSFEVTHPEFGKHIYTPTPKQLDFSEATGVNCIIEGSRGTGKSVVIRNDAHMRSMAYPGYCYLIVRRTMPELRKTHLKFLAAEMKKLGGSYNKTEAIAYYPNGSLGFYGHCETEEDMMSLLGSEYCAIYFDEISTFTKDMVTKVSSCARVPEDSGLTAIIRGGTNPIGIGADYIYRAFVLKDLHLDAEDPEFDPEYIPEDYQAIHTTLDDNPFIDKKQYVKILSRLPEHIRRAWLEGEWIVEGAYFHDFKPTKKFEDGTEIDWHVTTTYPRMKNRDGQYVNVEDFDWIQIYRTIDWGFSPDPACCLWIAVLPNGQAVVIKERTWKAKTARHVADCIKAESQGMRVVETYCDPSMFFGSEATGNNSVGDIIEAAGIALTPVKNDRIAAGYAIHELLNSTVGIDETTQRPKVVMFGPGCPQLVKTLPSMRMDEKRKEKIADHPHDHWVIAFSYFCMQRTGVSKETFTEVVPRWMRPVSSTVKRLGAESVRRR
jgi:hypothetical protein